MQKAISSTSSLLNNRALSPAISRKAPEEEHATGTPVAIASRTGSPTPSLTEGKMHASEFLYSSGKFSCGKYPVIKMSLAAVEEKAALCTCSPNGPSLPAMTSLCGKPVFCLKMENAFISSICFFLHSACGWHKLCTAVLLQKALCQLFHHQNPARL